MIEIYFQIIIVFSQTILSLQPVEFSIAQIFQIYEYTLS